VPPERLPKTLSDWLNGKRFPMRMHLKKNPTPLNFQLPIALLLSRKTLHMDFCTKENFESIMSHKNINQLFYKETDLMGIVMK
jgi:hypothetical protein